MILNPATVLNPVFNALDALVSDYGVYLYIVFVWLSLMAIAWVLVGGLRRRRSPGNSATVIYKRQMATISGKLPATKGVILRQVYCRLLSLFAAPILPWIFPQA